MANTNYSGSKCPNQNCNHTGFEIVEETPTDSEYILNFVRCYSCKTVVGVIDYYNLGDLLIQIKERIGA